MTEFGPMGLHERVTLEVGSAVDDQPPTVFDATIEEFGEGTVILAIRKGPAGLELASEAELTVRFHDESGLYEFESRMLDVVTGEPAVVTIAAPEHIKCQQRRQYIRTGGQGMELTGAVFDADTLAFSTFSGTVVDLGGGGVRMAIPPVAGLVEGASLVLALQLPRQSPVLAMGTVLGVGESAPDGGDRVEIRVAFSLIDRGERERVERWVYRQVGGSPPAAVWAPPRKTPRPR